MKKILLVVFIVSNSLWAQDNSTTCKILTKINTLLQKEHVELKPIDDSLSVFVFDNLINDLDPSRNLFFTSEYDSLAKNFRLHLDNLILKENCQFISAFESFYQKGLQRNKSLLEKLSKEPINLKVQDTLRLYKKAFPVYMTEKNMEKVWRKKIHFDVLTEIASMSKNLDSLQTNLKSLAAVNKEAILHTEICKINALLNRKSNIADKVYSYFCTYFDPYTNYLSLSNKSNFVKSLSKEQLSLGFLVSLNEKNQIIIEDIDPNGPAFKSGKLKKGDQIISIANKYETLEVSCASQKDLEEMIVSDSNKIITLTIKRKGEKNLKITLEKEVIADDQNTVFSFVIESKNRIGYIKIPSFYSNFENKEKTGCAEDVGREIIKLQNDNIEGLVIDLLDNGGGSMEEAIKLAALFVPNGPISIVIDKSKKQHIIQDTHQGYLYKGPVVIIVNSSTASASEFFTSILQDYNRALVIGNNTLGKATMQTILPLENEQDFVKVTINKFYRITGKSHQSIGIIPDVQVPVIYQTIIPREKDNPTAFKNDTLPNSLPFTPYITNQFIQTLSMKSQKRVDSNNYFNKIKVMNLKIDELIKNPKSVIPLQLESIFEEQNAISQLLESINTLKDESINLKVKNSTFNESLLIVYPNMRSKKDNQIKVIQNDHYLNEAIQIINDYIVLK